MDWLYIVVTISWLAFWAYWIAEAVRTTGLVRASAKNRQKRFNILMIFIIVFFVLGRIANLGQLTFHHQPLLKAAAAVVFYVGLALAIWARRHLGSSWGMPMNQTEHPHLITSGPYKYIRHPIYTGLFLATLACGIILTKTWLLGFAATLALGIYSSVQEEKMLARQLPKAYPAYQKHTKMFIPYLF